MRSGRRSRVRLPLGAPPAAGGFTLVEIMIVVVIIGLLAIDRTFDDGNLGAGTFQKMGSKAVWVIQP